MTKAIGHNSHIDGEKLASFVERVVNLEKQKRAYVEDIRDVIKEAQSTGFEPHALRAMVRVKLRDDKQAAKARARAETCAAYAAALQLEMELPL